MAEGFRNVGDRGLETSVCACVCVCVCLCFSLDSKAFGFRIA